MSIFSLVLEHDSCVMFYQVGLFLFVSMCILRRNHDVLPGWCASFCCLRSFHKIREGCLGEYLLIPSWSCVGMIFYQADPFLTISSNWSCICITRLGLCQGKCFHSSVSRTKLTIWLWLNLRLMMMTALKSFARQKEGAQEEEEEESGDWRNRGQIWAPTPVRTLPQVHIGQEVLNDARNMRQHGRWCGVPLHRVKGASD